MASVIDPESSLELVQRAAARDADALDRLLRRYIPSLTRWARGRLPSWARDLADTQDLVQETLFQTLRHLPRLKFERDGALHAYCRQAVMNRIYDEQRRVNRRPVVSELADDIPASIASPLEETIGQEALLRLRSQTGRRSHDALPGGFRCPEESPLHLAGTVSHPDPNLPELPATAGKQSARPRHSSARRSAA